MRSRSGGAPTSSRYGRSGRRRGVRVAGAGAGDRVEHRGGVADRAGQHELVRERSPVLAEVGSERRAGAGRLQADDPAHATRGTGSSRPCRCRARPAPCPPRPRPPNRRSIRRCCASRSHGLCVAPYASGSVVHARRELGRVGLADEHEAGGAEARREPRVVGFGPARRPSAARMPQWNGSPAVWHTASFTRNGTPAERTGGRPARRRLRRARVRSARG